MYILCVQLRGSVQSDCDNDANGFSGTRAYFRMRTPIDQHTEDYDYIDYIATAYEQMPC